MNDVTRILSAIEQGDSHAAEQLLPLVYDELRKLAAQKLAHEKFSKAAAARRLQEEEQADSRLGLEVQLASVGGLPLFRRPMNG
jgi:hypothetical protein